MLYLQIYFKKHKYTNNPRFTPDSKVPFPDPHQVVECEFDGKTSISADFGESAFPVMSGHRRLVAVWEKEYILTIQREKI